MQVVLVGVHPDAELAGVGGGLQDPDARGAGRRVDDVGALANSAPRPGSRHAAGVVPVMFSITLTLGLAATAPWA